MTLPQDPSDHPFHLRFWGVRGSIPVASSKDFGIGGNTACMQVLPAHSGTDELLIFDAGTGIRELGKQIVKLAAPPEVIHIFFTHFHWDHIQGLPYFQPLYAGKSRIVFHSAHPPGRLRDVLAAQMRAPYFPVFFDELKGDMEFVTIDSPQCFGDLTIDTFPLHHPQGSVGYRISHAQKTAVYATDHEHGEKADRRPSLSRSRTVPTSSSTTPSTRPPSMRLVTAGATAPGLRPPGSPPSPTPAASPSSTTIPNATTTRSAPSRPTPGASS